MMILTLVVMLQLILMLMMSFKYVCCILLHPFLAHDHVALRTLYVNCIYRWSNCHALRVVCFRGLYFGCWLLIARAPAASHNDPGPRVSHALPCCQQQHVVLSSAISWLVHKLLVHKLPDTRHQSSFLPLKLC